MFHIVHYKYQFSVHCVGVLCSLKAFFFFPRASCTWHMADLEKVRNSNANPNLNTSYFAQLLFIDLPFHDLLRSTIRNPADRSNPSRSISSTGPR